MGQRRSAKRRARPVGPRPSARSAHWAFSGARLPAPTVQKPLTLSTMTRPVSPAGSRYVDGPDRHLVPQQLEQLLHPAGLHPRVSSRLAVPALDRQAAPRFTSLTARPPGRVRRRPTRGGGLDADRGRWAAPGGWAGPICARCWEPTGVTLAGGVERPGPPGAGPGPGRARRPRARSASPPATMLDALLAASDVRDRVLHARGHARHARLRAERGCAHVIGTTGLDPEQDAASCAGCAQRIPIVWAPNMSLGVNLLLGLVEQAAATLDDGFDIEIVEMHHRHKVDAPSGTALALGRPRPRPAGGAGRGRRAGRATASPAPAAPARSALPPCAAATSSATIGWCSPARASGWS